MLDDVGSDDATLDDPHHPTGRPGARVPHVMLEQDGAPVSTLDLAGGGFALLTGTHGKPWADAAARSNRPLRAWRAGPDGDVTDPGGEFEAALGIGTEGAVLLRPDGVIGWRSTGLDAESRTRRSTRSCARSPSAEEGDQ